MSGLSHGMYLLAEIALRFAVNPRLRAFLLRILGARVGRNVRVYDCRFINLAGGFGNLSIADDVHLGTGCLLDLKGPVVLGKGVTISPRVNMLSHNDPGSSHDSRLLRHYACDEDGIEIGEYCWVGTAATLLSGTVVGRGCVVGAMSLVRGTLEEESLYVGVPARRVRRLAP